jgi:two-component system, OmpR family, sensor histidine kinase KdpD
MAETRLAPLVTRVLGWLAALAGPALLTAALVHVQSPQQRDYVFLYLGVVAVLGVLSGLWPAAVAAALSFLLVDFFFVPPVGTFTIADEQDIVRRLDVEAVLARNPEVVCVDDLTGTDVGGRLTLEAVPRLLAAGITVLATLDLLSVRSAADAVAHLLGRPLERPVVGDELLDMIDEFELVDIPPDELIRRIREKAILTPAQLARAMQQELRPQVLAVLRENLLRTCADRVDRQFVRELHETDGGPAGEVRGRIVLCLPVRAGLEERVRAAARYARAQDATFTVVSVRPRGLTEEDKKILGSYATLTHQLGGEFVRLDGRAVAPALARFIVESLATEVILGHRRGRGWLPWDTTRELIRLLQGVDIHVLHR